jgi:hypothetical protein
MPRLFPCAECGTPVLTMSRACPGCGAVEPKPVLARVAAIALLGLTATACGDKDDDTATDDTAAEDSGAVALYGAEATGELDG